VAGNHAAPAEALRDGPAARVADAGDHQLPVPPAAEGLAAMGTIYAGSAKTAPAASESPAQGRQFYAVRFRSWRLGDARVHFELVPEGDLVKVAAIQVRMR
jgi:hypothetical protein